MRRSGGGDVGAGRGLVGIGRGAGQGQRPEERIPEKVEAREANAFDFLRELEKEKPASD